MIATDPKLNDRRLRWERTIWVIDMVAYAVMAVNGASALWFTSPFVQEEIRLPAVIVVWGVLMLAGGAGGFFGRLFGLWAVEVILNVSAWSGAVCYAIIIFSAVTSGSSLVILGMVVLAFLFMFRRYCELQIFTSEPGLTTFTEKVRSLLRRRTGYVVRRNHY
ncbi:hypothetical protein EDF38_1317 [Frigoribacterium sp. PhB160]|uniref:hypothetical protein n=1 Tax=Frigoribacterium sp. PhB160 TaxID=2485192 RepID=UPI000F46322E|nr:hypothetical protein [Frigoribacterium sp. PhB160]ROS62214.1 hypothetical protein EDF38_1317 [Frigoribacterium sp. PhB160]